MKCLIVLVVNLLTGLEAFGPPVNEIALKVSVVILDGASVVQILGHKICQLRNNNHR